VRGWTTTIFFISGANSDIICIESFVPRISRKTINDKVVTKSASGPSGSYGFFDAKIAKSLISGQPVVLIDGVQKPVMVTGDANFWYIHVTYSHSERQITIGGSNTIPEFPPIPLLAIVFILAMIILRRRTKYLTTFNSPSPFRVRPLTRCVTSTRGQDLSEALSERLDHAEPPR
jgi:hypothetical protein